eukprot:scaffold105044_cov60-Phaeocystis_antarctica.AAC.3
MRRGSSSEAAGFVAEASSSVRPQSLSMFAVMSRRASRRASSLGKESNHQLGIWACGAWCTAGLAALNELTKMARKRFARTTLKPAWCAARCPLPRSNSPASLRSIIIRCLLASFAAGRASWHVDLQPHVSSGHNAAQQGHPPAEAA